MKLRTQLFVWLFIGTLVSGVTGVAAYHLATPDRGDLPNRSLVRKLSRRLGRADEKSRKQAIAEATETTGIPFEFIEPGAFPRGLEFRPPHEERGFARYLPGGPEHQGPILLLGDGYGYVPIMRGPPNDDGGPLEEPILVGAIRFPGGEHMALGLVPSMLAFAGVLFGFAQLLSRRLAGPLEQIGDAAARFGAGDLTARTHLTRNAAGAVETSQLAASFDAMAERISREVREGRELLGAVSHELRSPLGRAKVAVAVAREKVPQGELPTLQTAEKELVRVDSILGDLLASARMGLSDLRCEATVFVPWVRERIADEEMPPIIELEAPEASPESDVVLAIDRALVGRALSNLLTNARRYAPECPTIEVAIAVSNADITVSVSDRGPGFDSALLPKLFTPFVRGDDVRNPTGGSGLGLALVRRIAEAHGGRAFAENREGGGAIVTLALPRSGPKSGSIFPG